ncbi:hypothetical protein E1265_11475 [Streptomyces sp. 8K308]|uniref:hypothetical protein n=1 Tax=Streptomyces sp. 8K308 TaxID=2530388 RepID=UPI00104A18F5|nr:hypothetical protein [Streptomyces sp. 8K308]TDC23937.1 hypothetical protein E1265_11475 [Streptomyces sp. 8K308]
MFAVVLGPLVLWIFRSLEWALCLFVGTMLFFPFTAQQYSTDMWAYAAQAGRYGDAAAHYGRLGLVWDLIWLTRAARLQGPARPLLLRRGWLRRRHLSDRVLLALYRAY